MDTVVFRVDSSEQIGSGHLMRCLTLANYLRDKNINSYFVCRDLKGNLANLVSRSGFELDMLPKFESKGSSELELISANWEQEALDIEHLIKNSQQTDLLVVDHYALDVKFERLMRKIVSKIMVIDDLANRHHDCDLVLDQNFLPNYRIRYDYLIPKSCKKLLGPKYALLRPEFIAARKNLKMRDGRVNKVLICFGGSDPTNETAKVIRALSRLTRQDFNMDVIIGAANSNKYEIEALCSSLENATLYYQVSNMAELMLQADLFIGGGGTTTWERCFLGLPAITIAVADNQVEISDAVSLAGTSSYLGFHSKVSEKDIVDAFLRLLDDRNLVISMNKNSLALMQSEKGVNSRNSLAKVILEELC